VTRLAALAFVAALAVACTNSTDSSTPPLGILTLPSNARLTTDRFTGNLPIGGRANHTFTVTTGTQPINVTLTTAGPPSNVALGFGVGTLGTDGVCTPFPNSSTVAAAATKPQLAGTIDAGSFCLTVFDAGNQTGPVDYAFVVLHY
jgi:hypothetical protein